MTEPHIPDYILQVLARFGPMKTESDGWVFPCPCPTHGGKGVDRNPSLRVTIGENGKIIVHCRTGCAIDHVLSSVGLTYTDLYCPAGEEPASAIIYSSSLEPEERSYETLAEVYEFIIGSLDLHDSHAEEVEKRGIRTANARTMGYRSLLTTYDQDNLERELNRRFGARLAKVPGFRPHQEHPGQYQFAIDPKGMLVPIRSADRRIVALKTRRPITPKYIIWSTRNGPSAGTPVHCPLAAPESLPILRITEGEIKADIAWRKSGIYTISIPGVNAWPSALPVLKQLQPQRVLLSFDYPDVQNKGGVSRLLRLFAEELKNQNYTIGLESWETTNPDAKGIDDALQLELVPKVEWGEPALEAIRELHAGPKQDLHFFTPGEPEPFPMEVFPPIIREFISQHSQSIQCPEDFMATSVLAVAARCLGTSRSIRLDSKWTELPNQYFCIVAPPSAGKSPASKRVLAPIRHMQKQDALRYKDEKRQYKADILEWREEARNARREGEAPPEPPAPPRAIVHYWVSDITVETVALRLHDNGDNIRHDPSLLYFRDEILAWIKSLNAYRGGKGGDKEFFLSTWSNEDVKVDRKTENETLIVSSPALTILGGIQPDLLNELSNDSGKDDGFFARLLFSFPNTTPGFDPVNAFVPDNDLESQWETVCRRMLALSPEEVPNQSPEAISRIYRPVAIPLSDEARALWNQWHQHDNTIIRDPHFPAHLQSAWGKHRAILARLALVFHYLHGACIEDAEYQIDQPITAPAMQCAIAAMAYYRAHFQRVLRRIHYSPKERRVENFVKHVLDQHHGSISLRDVYRNRLFDCKGREDAEELCKLAEDRGYGILEKCKSGERGRPSYLFVIQPC